MQLVKDDRKSLSLAEGLSVYETFDQAWNQTQKHPYLGQLIAELEIPDDNAAITIERGGARSGHCTLWITPADGQAATILGCVKAVRPVQ